MLQEISIKNYRCFKDFYIDNLARVNLLVGNNNSGKTSFLEAVYLFGCCHISNLQEPLLETLHNRGEFTKDLDFDLSSRSPFVISSYPIKNIFYGHQLSTDNPIVIRTIQKHEFQKFQLIIYYKLGSNQLAFKNFYYSEMSAEELSSERYVEISNDQSIVVNKVTKFLMDSFQPYLFLPNNRQDLEQLSAFWNKIILTPKEERVIKALQIIEPKLERIGFTVNRALNAVLIKLREQENPVPLSSMGEGMYRLLSLATAAVTAENGVLLVDEIETGLHYETQADMWRLIIETAKELNVQVFATTHSWDCIAAFQEALEQEEDKSVGKLFRLDSKYGEHRAVEYTADELDIAVRQSIEVR